MLAVVAPVNDGITGATPYAGPEMALSEEESLMRCAHM